jgi:SAM-dependent methyltransferase
VPGGRVFDRRAHVQLVQKLQKLGNADWWHSTRAAWRRLFYPLKTGPFLAAVDREKFDALRERYYRPGFTSKPSKYLDLDDWMRRNVKRAREQDIRAAPPRLRVLDIGSGAGYFLHVVRCLGHEPLGLDIDEEPIFGETVAALDLPRVIHRIEAFRPLPDFGAPFDLVTAHLTCFNRRSDGSHWGREEWDYFLGDLGGRMQPGGRMNFQLNALPDGRHMEDDLRDYFLSRGARVDRRKVYLRAPLPRALTAR